MVTDDFMSVISRFMTIIKATNFIWPKFDPSMIPEQTLTCPLSIWRSIKSWDKNRTSYFFKVLSNSKRSSTTKPMVNFEPLLKTKIHETNCTTCSQALAELKLTLSSQSFCDSRNDYLSLCPSLPLSVCPAIKAYISVTMSWILMKLGELWVLELRSDWLY